MQQNVPFYGPKVDESKTVMECVLLHRIPEKCSQRVRHLEG